MSELYLAVDAGNTKTWAGLSTADGELVGLSQGGIGDIYAQDGSDAAKNVILGLIADVLRAAGAGTADIRHGAFLMAGVDWPDDEQLWRHELRPVLGDATLTVKNDGFALLRCGRLDGQGVSVVLGTGAALAGRGPVKEWALSWWMQHPLGAAGLVSEALRAVFLAALGLGPPTKLTDVLPALFGATSSESLLEATTRRERAFTHTAMASRAPSILALADEDPVVAELVRAQAEHVVDYTRTLVRACGLDRSADPVTVVVGGGLLREPTAPMFTALTTTFAQYDAEVDLRANHAPALVGALLDALAEGGVPLSESVRERLSLAVRASA